MRLLHGIGSRQDLPLPFEFVVAGASATLLITFILLVFSWREPRYDRPRYTAMPRLSAFVDHAATRWGLRTAVAAIWLLVGAALVGGVDRIDNPVFGFTYVLVWVGLVPVSLLLGQIWRATNPIRTLLLLVGRRRCAQPAPSVLPGAIALFGFCFLELAQPDRATLPVIRAWAAIWLIWLFAGILARRPHWIASADPFEVYASMLAQASPWTRSSSGVLARTSPLRNLGTWRPPRFISAVAVVLLGGTAYDSFSNVLWWVQFVQNSSLPRVVWDGLGLTVMVLVVAFTYYGAAAAMRLPQRSVRQQADLLAPGLVPIVAGYAIAHYATLLWLEGQRTMIQLSDPLGRGWNLFGTAELGVNTAIIGYSSLIASLQVAAIVGGHVIGVLVSHDIAIRHLQDDGRRFGRQVTGQLPMLAVMVFYTVSGLLLLFA